MKTLLHSTVLVCVLLVALHWNSVAQNTKSPKHSTSGTEFYCVFLPNVASSSDSVSLVIVADSLASGSISFTRFDGQFVKRDFTISDPKKSFTFSVSSLQAALRGHVTDTVYTPIAQNEQPLRTQVFSIQSNAPITVYGLNKGRNSSDGFIVLPVQSLGASYSVAAYSGTTIFHPTPPDSINVVSSTPSQYAVVATQNSTVVEILQRVPSSLSSLLSKTITLNKGEVYLVQSSLVDTLNDVSSTTVHASKPVAVFAGAQSTRVATNSATAVKSHVCEQLIPMEFWGTDYIVTPFPSSTSSNGANDVVRILSAYDSTSISINGTAQVVYSTKALEIPLNTAIVITAENPISVYSVRKSSSVLAGEVTTGNACMVNAHSIQHYSSEIKFSTLQQRDNQNLKVFNDQYVTLVVPTKSVSSLIMDDAPLTMQFSEIPGTVYSYGTRKIADGLHTILCNEPIGATVVGYGDNQGYAIQAALSLPEQPYLRVHYSLSDADCNDGDTVNISVRLDSLQYPPAVMNFTPSTYSMLVRFNATVLTPANPMARGEIIDGYQYARFSGNTSTLKVGDTLTTLQLIAGLGDAATSNVEIEEVIFLDSSNDTIPTTVTQKQGVFTLSNVWKDSLGTRLINPQSDNLSLSIAPNPVVSTSVVNYWAKASKDVSLQIFNTMGAVQLDLTETARNIGNRGYIDISSSMLPQGVYYVRFTAGEFIIVRPIIVRN